MLENACDYNFSRGDVISYEGRQILLTDFYVDSDPLRDEPRFAGRFVVNGEIVTHLEKRDIV